MTGNRTTKRTTKSKIKRAESTNLKGSTTNKLHHKLTDTCFEMQNVSYTQPLPPSEKDRVLEIKFNKTNNMKTKFITLIFLLFATISFAQSTLQTPLQNISTDSAVNYRLFSTQNLYTFIKLDTRNGKMCQVQWSTKGSEYRFETTRSDISLVNKEEEKNGRFFLYPTTNIYNFILLDQIDGRAWQVQWGNKEDRMVLQIY